MSDGFTSKNQRNIEDQPGCWRMHWTTNVSSGGGYRPRNCSGNEFRTRVRHSRTTESQAMEEKGEWYDFTQ